MGKPRRKSQIQRREMPEQTAGRREKVQTSLMQAAREPGCLDRRGRNEPQSLILAAGSAFAADHVTGNVTRVDPAFGDIWLENGVKFAVRTEIADTVSITSTDDNNKVDVLAASPAT